MTTKNEKFSKVPILDRTNYLFLKARMQIYLKSKDERIWQMVVRDYVAPTITASNGTTGSKPEDTWDDNDFNRSKWNNQGLNVIQNNVTKDEFRKIYNCTTSKEMWDI